MWTGFLWRQSDIILTFLQIEQGPANIQTCSTAFSEHKSFLLHEASTYIFQDMTKDLEVPFVPSKTWDLNTLWASHNTVELSRSKDSSLYW